MKKIIFSLIMVCGLINGAFSQKKDYLKRPAIGINFFGNDFQTPARIKATSLSDVLNDNQWATLGEHEFGFGLNYMKGLTNKLDFSTTLGVSFVDYPVEDRLSDGKDGALFEWDAMVHAKMLTDKYWVVPYLSAGVGASQWRGYFGAIVPVGVGIQVSFFDEAFLLINSQYRLGVTSSTTDHFYHSIGFAGNIGKPREVKVIPPPPMPVVSDRDSDGIVDSLDACPDVAGLAALAGCPDKDADGIADKDDKCPDVPGIATYQGCPIPDTDNDGVNDEEDKCKDVPGVARFQGCPVPDRDNDGVNDEEDRCPDIAGPVENGGCPMLETSKFNASAIQFITGSAALTAASKKELDKAARILNEQYPTIKVEIAGHTDNTGKPESNKTLSEKRAGSVKAYLVKKGVAEDRLTTVGFGQEQPIADNANSAGKAKNRRVEFKVSQ
ncbi:OmpA family protein [Flavihumibacter fluvii]|uniref:OmpA family protein n=1 Tax=Flavihumibacter fluvii TaxID=2838157 RepID=UPI001BDF2E09|nr:OmpA family protein [Flavihumibacter fluvii]ULQ53483.1 OmpA family protein [Flavihumibacter fluvii]